ncbi:hypothetical protein PybrP1_010741 [[Pythium] brassicae (nom. inval.)]|nr:hypothetical protein PybrP1_010741 [[Pythium] brassicae (nom. inval.)]
MRSGAFTEDVVVGSHQQPRALPTGASAHSDDELELDAFQVTMRLDQEEAADASLPAPPTPDASPASPTPSATEPAPHVEIAFSGSGGMFTYQMGVAAYIQDHFDVSACRFSGCSGGSWAATLLAAETSVHAAWKVILANQQRLVPANYSWYSGYGRYAEIVRSTIQELWADDHDVHARVQTKHLHIAVTRFPSLASEMHSSWTSLDDLMTSILASALVPFALSGRPYIEHRGRKYIDGCVSNFKGVNLPPTEYSTRSDIAFHAKKLVVDSTRAGLGALASYLLPAALHKPLAAFLHRALPTLTAAHEVIAPLSLAAGPTPTSAHVRRLLIRPWTWRGHSLTAYHLTVDVATHQERFDTGYKDAMEHHHEFAAVLPLRQPLPARAA